MQENEYEYMHGAGRRRGEYYMQMKAQGFWVRTSSDFASELVAILISISCIDCSMSEMSEKREHNP